MQPTQMLVAFEGQPGAVPRNVVAYDQTIEPGDVVRVDLGQRGPWPTFEVTPETEATLVLRPVSLTAAEEKKLRERGYVSEARAASPVFPSGRLRDHERPDFIIAGGAGG